MALQTDNLMLLDISGIPRTIEATDELKLTTDLIIGGDLTVDGDIVSVGTRDVVVTDNFIDLNNGNVSTARAGGLTVQIEGSATRSQALDANSGVTFESIASSGGANARFNVNGIDFTTTPANAADRLAVNDIIQISGLSSAGENNGLFAVKSIAAGAGGWVEIKNVSEQTASTPFTQTNFEDATEDVAGSLVAWSLNIGVMTISDGTIPQSGGGTVAKGNFATAYAADADDQGSGSSGFAYGDAASVSLQEAYDEGQTISTSNGNAIAFTLADGGFTATGAGAVALTPTSASSFTSGAGLTLTGGAASTWSTSSGALTLTSAAAATWSTGAGILTLDGAAGMNIAGNAGEIDITTTDAVDINSGAGTWDASTFDLTASAASTWTGQSVAIDSTGGALNLDAVGGGISITAAQASDFTTAAGALTITAAAASTWSTGAGALTLDGAAGVNIAGNASEIDITTTDAVDINSGAGTWNCSTLDIEGSGAATWTGASVAIDSTGGALNLDAVGGGISLTAAQASDFTTAAGALTITAAGASTWSTGAGALTLDGAAGMNIVGNAGEVDITTTGTVDINSGAGTWDASSLNLTASAADDANPVIMKLEVNNTGTDAGDLMLEAKTAIILGDSGSYASALIDANHWMAFQQSAGFEAEAGVNLVAGEAVYLYNDGGTAKLGKAESDNATENFRVVIGLVAADASAGNACRVQSVAGTKMRTAMTGLAAGTVGDAVYLHTTAGELSLTAPTASGTSVFRVGYVADNDGGPGGTAQIVFMPQFIAKRP